ncbi:MAG: hypothetical protein HC870_00980, partial [Rhizobiales bacterium]|nr:hypothetical protein [Hyphomicrobiales bacterium]
MPNRKGRGGAWCVTATGIDDYLTLFVSQSLHGEAAPAWPESWPASTDLCDQVFARIAFHGIALLIIQRPAALDGWPAPLRDRVQAEARAQSFWELGHRAMLKLVI